MNPQEDHWLVRPATIRALWRGGLLGLACLVVADFFVPHQPYFGFDGWPGFAAGLGFMACVGMVISAKALGKLLKKPDDYYGE